MYFNRSLDKLCLERRAAAHNFSRLHRTIPCLWTETCFRGQHDVYEKWGYKEQRNTSQSTGRYNMRLFKPGKVSIVSFCILYSNNLSEYDTETAPKSVKV